MNVNRNFLVVIILLSIACGVTKNRTSCKDFRNGKFSMRSEFDGSETVIERRDSIQIETNLASGSVINSKVSWTNPCEYELMYTSSIVLGSDSIHSFVQARRLKTKILKVEDDYYIFESSMDGIELKLIDTLRVLK